MQQISHTSSGSYPTFSLDVTGSKKDAFFIREGAVAPLLHDAGRFGDTQQTGNSLKRAPSLRPVGVLYLLTPGDFRRTLRDKYFADQWWGHPIAREDDIKALGL